MDLEKIAESGYIVWKQDCPQKNVDQWIEPLIQSPVINTTVYELNGTRRSWLQIVRESLWLTTREVAERMNVPQSSYARLEKNEVRGNITLASLERAAEAMDCELVYAIRPKSHRPISSIVWDKVAPEAKRLFQKRFHHPIYHSRPNHQWAAFALAAIARELVRESKFRLDQGWTRAYHKRRQRKSKPKILQNPSGADGKANQSEHAMTTQAFDGVDR
jgi:transcriptional regulator with XRE-family HTH domain